MSVINLDEVGTLCLPRCLSLSPNLVLNDPFPLFSRPIFYRLDHAQYGGLFMQMSVGWHGGKCEQSQTECRLQHTVEETCQSNKEPRNKREHASLDPFPASSLFFYLHSWDRFDTLLPLWAAKVRKSIMCSIAQQKKGPAYGSSSPCIPGSLTEVKLAYRRSPCKISVQIETCK